MNDFPPPEPNVSTDALEAIAAYASETASWLMRDLNGALGRGVMPHPKQLKNIEGWRFVALALTEMQMLNAKPAQRQSERTP